MHRISRSDFGNFLRTGRIAGGGAVRPTRQFKFNPNHDPDDGRFTFAPGTSGSLQPRAKINWADRQAKPRSRSLISRPDPIGDIIEDRLNRLNSGRQLPDTLDEPQRPKSPSALSHRPIAGATVQSLNRADKPGEGDPAYGSRRTRGKHRGIDIAATQGTPVRAAADGVVVRIVPNPSHTFGDQVVIFHGKGVFTQYAHLEHGSVRVRPGARVRAGQSIARVGRTGNTPREGDSHLHFEVRIGSSAPASVGGHTRDPLEYLPK